MHDPLPDNSRYATDLSGDGSGPAYALTADWDDLRIAYGQYAAGRISDTGAGEFLRDPLGIDKVFYTRGPDGRLAFSSRFTDLLCPGARVFAAPRGAYTVISDAGERIQERSFVPLPWHDPLTVEQFRSRVIDRLARVFELIRRMEDDGWRVFVALSGGLDSTTIAHLARRHLRNPVACTLDLGRSEDAEKSRLISGCLGILHTVFSTSPPEILQAVADAPPICQDFRDFNVHCAVLNLILGQNIRAMVDQRAIVLTGDLMNEYTNDYAQEIVDGTVYYRLPRVGGKTLQKHLVGGIDTSDREISPFAHHGLLCIQPYAVLHDLYLGLDECLLEGPRAKHELNSFLVPDDVLQHLPQSKLRAQVGSKESMGVLGLCHREGIGEAYFVDRLLHGVDASRDQIPIVMGRYGTERFTKQHKRYV